MAHKKTETNHNNHTCKTCKIHDHDALKFPKGFLWGAATSAHQVEGGNTNDWSKWEEKNGNILDGTTSFHAADQFNRFKEDFALAKKFNHKIHRLSIEWSRIEPEPGKFNHEAIRHYHKVFDELTKKKIKIMLTLHHFTNPVWFSEIGGWKSKKSIFYFNRFVEKMAKEYHKKINYWITINEPNVYASNGFLRGLWPPQKKSVFAYRKVLRNMARAHKKAFKTIHKQDKIAFVGIAKNTFSIESYRWWLFEHFIKQKLLNYVWNHYFLRKTKGYHDFIGINYYFHTRIRKSGLFVIKTVDAREEHREGSDLGWEIYPNGLFQTIMNMKQYNLPMFITENGLAALNDHRRCRFIVSHTKEVYHAIKAGADVWGYCFWSLVDNFEWDKGLEPRFGLISIDYKTQKRKPRNSAYVYAKICKENSIAHDLLRYIGHEARDEEPGL